MSRRRAWAMRILPAAVFLAAGCTLMRGTPSMVRNYYTIDYIPSAPAAAASQLPYPYALQVGHFDVERATNRQNIVFRYSPHQLQYYERERWAVRPDDMIRDMVFKHLNAARLTNHLALSFPDTRPDFRLDGMVEALERLDAGDLFFSHMAMSLKLIRIETGDEVWSYSFDRRRRVHSGDMVRTVQGLSDILQTEMNVAITQLDSIFLAASMGQPLMPAAPAPSVSHAQRDPAAEGEVPGLDESAFEIIRER